MKYRITHPDPLNWCIEEFQEAGSTISRGRFAGQETKATWKAAKEFYPSLKQAVLGLLHKHMSDELLDSGIDTAAILAAINTAEEHVLMYIPTMGDGTPLKATAG